MLHTNSHRSIMESCLSGIKTHRVPVSLWRHFPVDDQSPVSLAAATLAFQRAFDFDFIKVTPASSFATKDWGAVDEWKGSPEGTREYGLPVIQHPEDWNKLNILDPVSGSLGAQLECLRILKTELGPDTPIIQTIFSPLSQAKNLVGKSKLLDHLHHYPDALHEGLSIITETTIRFIDSLRSAGIDGIFYAVQHASFDLLSLTEFEEFGKKYDIQVLDKNWGFWLNMAHIHGENLMFDALTDYPVQILNWHDRHTPPDLKTSLQKFDGVVCGGLRRWETMALGTPQEVSAEASDAIHQVDGRRFILGTGCVLPIVAPYGNIIAARQSVETP